MARTVDELYALAQDAVGPAFDGLPLGAVAAVCYAIEVAGEDLVGSALPSGAEGIWLDLIGEGFGIKRAAGESDAAYLTRIQALPEGVIISALTDAINALLQTEQPTYEAVALEHFKTRLYLDDDATEYVTDLFLDEQHLLGELRGLTFVLPEGLETALEDAMLATLQRLKAAGVVCSLLFLDLSLPTFGNSGQWVLVELADATYEFDDGFADVVAQAADGEITFQVKRSNFFDRYLPYDSQAPHTWAIPMVDYLGNSVDFWGGEHLRCEFYLDIDWNSADVNDQIVIWIGIMDGATQPDGVLQSRVVGVLLAPTILAIATAKNTVESDTVASQCHLYGWVDTDNADVTVVALTQDGNFTALQTVPNTNETVHPVSDGHIVFQVGTADFGTTDLTDAVKVTPWYRVTSIEDGAADPTPGAEWPPPDFIAADNPWDEP